MNRRDIEQLYLGELGITHPDEIDIEAIAYYLDATVKYQDLRGCEARIVGLGDKAVIRVNSGSIRTRQRFSVGHELGHWLCHRGALSVRCEKSVIQANRTSTKKAVPGREKLANNYASEMLAPAYLVRSLVDNQEVSFDLINDLRTDFRISRTAACIKYVDLCEYPAFVSSYSRKGRNWYHLSKSVPERVYPVWQLKEGSIAYGIIHGRGNGQKLIREIDSDSWVDLPEAELYTVMECSWQTQSDEIISFVWWRDEEQLLSLIE